MRAHAQRPSAPRLHPQCLTREEEAALCPAATRVEPSEASALREGRQAGRQVGEQGVDEKPLMVRGPPLWPRGGKSAVIPQDPGQERLMVDREARHRAGLRELRARGALGPGASLCPDPHLPLHSTHLILVTFKTWFIPHRCGPLPALWPPLGLLLRVRLSFSL